MHLISASFGARHYSIQFRRRSNRLLFSALPQATSALPMRLLRYRTLFRHNSNQIRHYSSNFGSSLKAPTQRFLLFIITFACCINYFIPTFAFLSTKGGVISIDCRRSSVVAVALWRWGRMENKVKPTLQRLMNFDLARVRESSGVGGLSKDSKCGSCIYP